MTAELIERADKLKVDRPRRRRRRQRRRRRRDQARHHRRQRAAVERRHRRRAHDRADARRSRATSRRRTRRCARARWERSKFRGVELYEKTLGILGFGRIGQLVAARARGFGMHVIAFDPFVSAERYRELGVEKAGVAGGRLRARPTSSRSTCPRTPETRGHRQRRGVREDARRRAHHQLRPRRADRRRRPPGGARLRQGRAAPRSTSSTSEPITEHPLFGYPNVVVTPHLGASTAEAQDRAGVQTAEQVVAALTGGVVTTAVNIPSISAEDMEVARAVRAAVPAARPAGDGARRGLVGRAHRGRVPRPHRRARHAPADARGADGRPRRPRRGGRQPRQRAVAGRGARDRRCARSRSRTRATSPTSSASRSSAATTACASSARLVGRRERPHLLEAWGQRFNLQLEDHIVLFRYSDVPGMIGRVGHDLRRARHQHRPDGRRPAADGRSTGRR